MATGNIPQLWYSEPWSEERAGKIISNEIGIEFKGTKRPMEWISHLVKLIVNIRHREVFMYRYGLMDDAFHTYEEVAEKFEFSRSRAFQLDQEIIDRLQKRILELESIS